MQLDKFWKELSKANNEQSVKPDEQSAPPTIAKDTQDGQSGKPDDPPAPPEEFGTNTSPFFVVDGPLKPNAPSYIKRSADNDLKTLIKANKLIYILAAPKTGKSSLINHTAYDLKEEGVQSAIVNLTSFEKWSQEEEWYFQLLEMLTRQLSLSIALEKWWEEQLLDSVQRFKLFLQNVVLTEIRGPVVIFVDQIEETLHFDFSDDFFAAIRCLYNARAKAPTFERLTFVLSGTASPSELIQDDTRSPFNVGQAILLPDFHLYEVKRLQNGLQKKDSTQAEAILTRIYYWTDGHPYQTQKLCQAIVRYKTQEWTDERIAKLVEDSFLNKKNPEKNLQDAKDRILNHPEQPYLAGFYGRILRGSRKKTYDPKYQINNELKLSAILNTIKVRAIIFCKKVCGQINYIKSLSIVYYLLQ